MATNENFLPQILIQVRSIKVQTATFETITPKMAEDFLASSLGNRNLREPRVRALTAAMVGGAWRPNGESIKVDVDGHLIDGHHRLTALTRFGKSMQLLVVRNIPHNAHCTIDTGASRTAADVLKMAGAEHYATLAAAARVNILYRRTGRLQDSGAQVVTNSDVLNEGTQNNRLIDAVNRVRGEYGMLLRFKLLPPSVAAFLLTHFDSQNADKADEFFRILAGRLPSGVRCPAFLLRERLILNAASKRKISKEEQAALAIKAWVAFRDGVELRQLKWTTGGEKPETFPSFDIQVAT